MDSLLINILISFMLDNDNHDRCLVDTAGKRTLCIGIYSNIVFDVGN